MHSLLTKLAISCWPCVLALWDHVVLSVSADILLLRRVEKKYLFLSLCWLKNEFFPSTPLACRALLCSKLTVATGRSTWFCLTKCIRHKHCLFYVDLSNAVSTHTIMHLIFKTIGCVQFKCCWFDKERRNIASPMFTIHGNRIFLKLIYMSFICYINIENSSWNSHSLFFVSN